MSAPHTTRRSFLGTLGISALVWATACATGPDDVSAQSSGRCARCGMRVTRGAAFSSGARTAAGAEVVFDSVKCMFRWLGQHTDAQDPWVTEHLSRTARPARDTFFVAGSDLEGPMGADLVPVDTRAHAEQILAGHHGARILAFVEVTPEVLDALRP